MAAGKINPRATGRTLGAYKSAAKKCGLSLDEWFRRRLSGQKRCFRCKVWKDTSLFSADKSRIEGSTHCCKPCTSRATTASRYNTTSASIAAMVAKQGGACPICKRKRKLVVDHHHRTGQIRAMLCNRCNVGLGQFKDDITLLRSALSYLESHHG